MNELALFAGAGGGVLGGHLLGWRTICAVERDAYAAQILAQRQNDGALDTFPIWSDVCSFDGKPWRGLVDVISGGFPCQDISSAGSGVGIDGARSGLWRQMARIIGEVRPTFVYVENSPMLVGRGLAVVIGDLAEMGYDAQWGIVGAADLGAPHQRDRIWIVANTNGTRQPQPARCKQERGLGFEQCGETLDDTERKRQHPGREDHQQYVRYQPCPANQNSKSLANTRGEHGEGVVASSTDSQVWRGSHERSAGSCSYGFRRWPTEPGMGRVADGVAHRVDRIKALGNGQVPRVAAAAFTILSE